MNFNEHSDLVGQHAFLSASKYHWSNYDNEKLAAAYRNHLATQRGTDLHNFAAQCIRLKQRLPKTQATLNMYVNDAIGFRMIPEQVLFFSEKSFGTADAILFKNDKLRIHDLKTGISPTSMRQPEIYTALFCLEYAVDPHNIEIELRIYQNAEIVVHVPEPDAISEIMTKIITFNKIIRDIDAEE